LLQLWIKIEGVNLYGEKKITQLPTPEFYVVYNGSKKLNSEVSDFVIEHTDIKIDVKVKIVDIKYSKLKHINAENALAGYSYFYKIYGDCKLKGLSDIDAFTEARAECVKKGYLNGLIDKEGFVMFYKDILDYDTQLREEGKVEGKMEGFEKAIYTAIRANASLVLIEALAAEANISKARLNEMISQATT